MWTKMLHLVLGGVLLAGCFGNLSEGPAPPVGGTRDRLQSTLEVGLEPGSCRTVVTAQRQYQGEMARQIDLPVLGGTVALRAWPDGRLEVEDLRVDLDDVVLDEYEFPPNGVHLTGITLTLRDVGEADAKWIDEGAQLEAKGQVDLLLDWAAVNDNGSVLPLGTQQVTAVTVEVEVSTTADGKALVKLHGRRHGEFVEATGLFAISDLGLELRAVG
jgi:hypothetical protein